MSTCPCGKSLDRLYGETVPPRNPTVRQVREFILINLPVHVSHWLPHRELTPILLDYITQPLWWSFRSQISHPSLKGGGGARNTFTSWLAWLYNSSQRERSRQWNCVELVGCRTNQGQENLRRHHKVCPIQSTQSSTRKVVWGDVNGCS